MSDLLKLAERCEAATGPDYPGLDTDIHEAIGNCVHRETEYYQVQSDTGFTCKACRKDTYGFTIPKYSASIDAAMSLRPDGHTMASMSEEDTHDPLRKCAAEYRRGFKTSYDKAFPARAATLPLALCAAALRARSEAAAVGGR